LFFDFFHSSISRLELRASLSDCVIFVLTVLLEEDLLDDDFLDVEDDFPLDDLELPDLEDFHSSISRLELLASFSPCVMRVEAVAFAIVEPVSCPTALGVVDFRCGPEYPGNFVTSASPTRSVPNRLPLESTPFINCSLVAVLTVPPVKPLA
jgi:hypothetical protein